MKLSGKVGRNKTDKKLYYQVKTHSQERERVVTQSLDNSSYKQKWKGVHESLHSFQILCLIRYKADDTEAPL